MLQSYTKQEIREVVGVAPRVLTNPTLVEVQDEAKEVAVVLLDGEKQNGRPWTDRTLPKMSHHCFLIDRQVLVSFARLVLEELDPSPELATLQRIETLLEERLPEKSCDTP